MNPATFLQLLWGDQPPGLIQLFRLDDRRTHCLATPDKAEGLEGAVDQYTAVCTSRTDLTGLPERAKGPDLQALAGLWLDIDVGPNGAPTIPAAIELAGAHRQPTLTVLSGRGVHAWHLFHLPWRMATAADRATAARAAAGWYALHATAAARRGYTLDQSTRDLTRLLRPPGTLNGKTSPPAPVRLHEPPGQRHDRRALFATANTALTATTGAGDTRRVSVLATTGIGVERLELIFEADPAIAETFHHRGGRRGWTLSEWDMSLAARAAAGGLPDQTIADLIATHRLHHDPADIKHRRTDYLARTITRARHDDAQTAETLDLAREARTRTAA